MRLHPRPRLSPATIVLGPLLFISLPVSAQPAPVAEGMITPTNPTGEADIVVVQVPTDDAVPGGPSVVASPLRRLVVSAHADADADRGTAPSEQNLGRLEPGTWQLYSQNVDWSTGDGKPTTSGFSAPATFVIGGGEVYPVPLQPIASRPFRVHIAGQFRNSCVPEVDRVSIDDSTQTVVVHTRRIDPVCLPSGPGPAPWKANARVRGLTAGRYRVEVRVPELDESLPDMIYASATFRVVDPGSARIVDIGLETDPERAANQIVVDVENPRTIVGNSCSFWELEPRTAWAHGRDLYVGFAIDAATIEPPTVDCNGTTAESYRFPVPDIGTGLYRVIVQQAPAELLGEVDFWAQSATLLEGRSLTRTLNSRFTVAVEWRDHAGRTGRGFAVEPKRNRSGAADRRGDDDADSAVFAFFDNDNWELMVKVLDACSLNDHFWVFGSASTDVEYSLTVEDTITGARVRYQNELGTASPAITDTTALAVCEDN